MATKFESNQNMETLCGEQRVNPVTVRKGGGHSLQVREVTRYRRGSGFHSSFID